MKHSINGKNFNIKLVSKKSILMIVVNGIIDRSLLNKVAEINQEKLPMLKEKITEIHWDLSEIQYDKNFLNEPQVIVGILINLAAGVYKNITSMKNVLIKWRAPKEYNIHKKFLLSGTTIFNCDGEF